MPVDDPNLGVAFGLVIGAGMATALGAAIVFIPWLAKRATRRVLASALGVSAGVMIYVSFVEILQKANASFLDAGYEENEAYLYATLCFFGGVVFMVLLNYVVTAFLGGHHHHHHDPQRTQEVSNDESMEPPPPTSKTTEAAAATTMDPPHCMCCAEDPQGELDKLQQMAEEIDTYEHQHPHHHWEGKQTTEVATHEEKREVGASREESEEENLEAGSVEKLSSEGIVEEVEENLEGKESGGDAVEEKDKENDEHEEAVGKRAEDRKLMRMSINTALAIGLHNFPEGLATFVAALDDPAVGTVLAIAIAIHNIPEGLCVAMPIYYATGSRWKAFGWAVLSGISEPIAALLGWAVLANSFSDVTYAILFGMVAGMMVIISARELLPTAHRYDPEDTVVTYSMIAGMVIMALSLVLFLF